MNSPWSRPPSLRNGASLASPSVTGTLKAGSDNAVDVGESATKFRTGYFGTSVIVGTSSTWAISGANGILRSNGANGAWFIQDSAGSVTHFLMGAPNTQTGTTYTVAAADNFLIINAGATCTLTLPSATNAGRVIRVKTIAAFTVVSASSNVVPLAGGSAGTAILAATAGKWADLVSDGTNWVLMAAN